MQLDDARRLRLLRDQWQIHRASYRNYQRAVGSQLLPDYYRALSPWMPAPQLFTAMRGALYFNGEGVITPVLVLFGWIAGGVVLMVLGHAITSRRRAPAPAIAPAPAPEN